MADLPAFNILDLTKLTPEQLVRIDPLDERARAAFITWNIGKRCNYACSYCGLDLHDKTSPHRSLEDLIKAWLRMRPFVAASGQQARIQFTGGEPTLNPDFHKFVEYLNRTQRRWLAELGMTTNGSESLAYYEDILSNLDHISFSTHFEWWDEAKFMTMLLDLWRRSGKNKNGKWILVHAMYEDWEAAGVRKARDIFEREGIPQIPFKILNVYGSKGIANNRSQQFEYASYLRDRNESAALSVEKSPHSLSRDSDDLSDMLAEVHKSPENVDVLVELVDGTFGRSNSVQLSNYGLTNFPGWTCHLENNVYIHNDGSIWAGNCKFQLLGNAYEGFTPLSGPVTCDGRFCMCPTDVRTQKYKTDSAGMHLTPLEWRRQSLDKTPKNAKR